MVVLRGPSRNLAISRLIDHVLNRGVGRMTPVRRDDDIAAFLRYMADVLAEVAVPMCETRLMPNHWHLVLWPLADGCCT